MERLQEAERWDWLQKRANPHRSPFMWQLLSSIMRAINHKSMKYEFFKKKNLSKNRWPFRFTVWCFCPLIYLIVKHHIHTAFVISKVFPEYFSECFPTIKMINSCHNSCEECFLILSSKQGWFCLMCAMSRTCSRRQSLRVGGCFTAVLADVSIKCVCRCFENISKTFVH